MGFLLTWSSPQPWAVAAPSGGHSEGLEALLPPGALTSPNACRAARRGYNQIL